MPNENDNNPIPDPPELPEQNNDALDRLEREVNAALRGAGMLPSGEEVATEHKTARIPNNAAPVQDRRFQELFPQATPPVEVKNWNDMMDELKEIKTAINNLIAAIASGGA